MPGGGLPRAYRTDLGIRPLGFKPGSGCLDRLLCKLLLTHLQSGDYNSFHLIKFQVNSVK